MWIPQSFFQHNNLASRVGGEKKDSNKVTNTLTSQKHNLRQPYFTVNAMLLYCTVVKKMQVFFTAYNLQTILSSLYSTGDQQPSI